MIRSTICLRAAVAVLVSACAVTQSQAGGSLTVVSPQKVRPQLFRTGQETGAARLELPEGEFFAENHLLTNLPATFSGANVNTLLGADAFYSQGLTGSNASLANIEAGHIWNGHSALSHVATFSNDVSAWDDPGTVGVQQTDLIDRHATWVGLVAGGRVAGGSPGEHQRGIAYGADLQSGALASSWSGTAYAGSFGFNGNSYFTPFKNYFGSSDVINSSWGGSDSEGTGFFSTLGDALANQNPSTTWVVSAGNSGSATNTVGSPGSAYNSITVAALQNNGANDYATVASFSSRGPQDWGGGGLACTACRAAVDIAAPGTNLTSAFYGGTTGGNNPTLVGSGGTANPNSYSSSVAGTSFSSPIVAGAATLVVDSSYADAALAANPHSRDARVVKSVLMNSADKIAGWDNGQVLTSGVVQTLQSLDLVSGAGALNIGRAYDQYVEATTRDVAGTLSGAQGAVGGVGWDFGEAIDGVDNVYLISELIEAGTDFTATLTWFRERTETYLADFSAQDIGQADLDLRIRDTISGIVVAESVSSVNVAEHLHFQAPATSLYQIEVEFFDDVFGSLERELYGLAWSAVTVPEPTTGLLVGITLLGAWGRRQRS